MLARLGDGSLRQQVAQLQADLDAEQRRLAVAQAEIDSLAAVIARDRARIAAEGAAYARQRAEAEGMTAQDEQQIPYRRTG